MKTRVAIHIFILGCFALSTVHEEEGASGLCTVTRLVALATHPHSIFSTSSSSVFHLPTSHHQVYQPTTFQTHRYAAATAPARKLGSPHCQPGIMVILSFLVLESFFFQLFINIYSCARPARAVRFTAATAATVRSFSAVPSLPPQPATMAGSIFSF